MIGEFGPISKMLRNFVMHGRQDRVLALGTKHSDSTNVHFESSGERDQYKVMMLLGLMGSLRSNKLFEGWRQAHSFKLVRDGVSLKGLSSLESFGFYHSQGAEIQLKRQTMVFQWLK